MSFLSDKIFRALQRNQLVPQIVLEIEGAPDKYSTVDIKKILRYGEENAFYGEGLEYGGFISLSDVKPYLDDDGSSLGIKQTLETDKGRSSSVTTLSLKVIDKNGQITKLISPGKILTDILYRKAKVWVSFGTTSSFSEDFEVLFRGNISSIDSGSGFVTFEVSSPDQKKRTALYPKAETELSTPLGFANTLVELNSTTSLLQNQPSPLHPTSDDSFRTCVKIEDEVIEYTGISGTILTGCTRASFGTIQSSHNDTSVTVESFYVLEGNSIDLALKLLLSDKNRTPYITDLKASSVNFNQSGEFLPNTFEFPGIDLIKEKNVSIGDYLTASSFLNSGNNFSQVEIVDVFLIGSNSYVTVAYETISQVIETTGKVSILSRYNTLPDGLGMVPDEVDIEQHEFIRDTFLSSASVRFFLKDTIENLKDFIGQELLKPFSAFEIPRFSRSSVGFHSPPIPNESAIVLNQDTILSSKNLLLKRRISKNFYNAVIHKFQDSVGDDKFLRSEVTIDTDSQQRVPIGNKPLIIESKGIREDLNGRFLSNSAAQRLLKKYRLGAEYIENIEVNFKTGFQVEIGSSVIFDPEGLKVTDTSSGKRNKTSSLFQVVNKNVELKTGKVTLSIEDANFDLSSRYGLVSPSSQIASVVDSKSFFIEQWQEFSSFGKSEYRKWLGLLFKNQVTKVVIRNTDFTIYETADIKSISFNKIELVEPVSIALASGMWLELAPYDEQTSENIKLLYTHLNENQFLDGSDPYVYL